MPNFNRIIFGVLSFVFFILPNMCLAASLQPAGEFPINEPLRSIEPGMKPNYSNSIDDDENKPANIVNNELQPIVNNDQFVVESTPAAEQFENEVVEKSNNKWLLGLVIIILAAISGGLFWRRKITRTEAALGLVGLLFLNFALVATSVNFAFAQNAPIEGPVIQRTIEEENSDGVLVSEVTPKQQAESDAQSQVIFGLAAILLVIVAMGAATMYWRNSHPLMKQPKTDLPPDLDL